MKTQAQFSRKGSALLIVLGMLSFMVVSAVSFAIYMRESRVPSSHLRRESTARYLLKSALANAVARLNGSFNTTKQRVEGLYDDPYPGLNGYSINNLWENGDYWTKHVFTPFGEVPFESTISTLTLEGLAYLPPALINEARVFSRTTRTAQWENLSYDLGRYAFCAIDVSDCFDVNKLASAKRRTSGDRISFSSLYPDTGSALATLIKGKISTVPFVSLADFNVAMGETAYTPFIRYINKGGTGGKTYLASDESVSNALFITDTWFPATNAYLTANLELKTPEADTSHFFDLSDGDDQPFAKGDFGCGGILEVPTTGRMQQIMKANLGFVGYACLYDYLDGDRVPISLALPTVEAVPMVCGVQIVGSMPFIFQKDNDDLPKDYPAKTEWKCVNPVDKQEHTIERTTEVVCFKAVEPEGARVVGTVMYPFKRTGTEERKGTFKVQALVGAFLADANFQSRVLNEKFRPTLNDWNNGGVRDGIAFYKTSAKAITLPNDVSTTDKAFIQFECDISEMDVCMPAYYVVTEKDVTDRPLIGGGVEDLPNNYLDKEVRTADGLNLQKTPLTLFAADGKTIDAWESAKKGRLYTAAERAAKPTETHQADVKGVTLNQTLVPHLAVWVRVLDENNKTVDLSPATFSDDEIWLEGCDYGGAANDGLEEFCGGEVAMLSFKGKQEFSVSDTSDPLTVFKGDAFEFQDWDALFAPDPRYNFAPEDWFGKLKTSATKGNCQQVVESVLGVDNRDRDIFMFTSDQEHLQSIGELQFLPYVQDFGQRITGTASDFFKGSRYHGDGNFAARTIADLDKEGAGMFANSSRFWRTYSGSDNTSRLNNPYYDLRAMDRQQVTVVNNQGGFRVNPLSPDLRVLSAAIFDTPWDYYIASTNRETNKIISNAEGSPESYAFGDASLITADQWNEGAVTEIARAICDEVREDAVNWVQHPTRRKYPFDWMSAYKNLWADYADEEPEYLFGHKLGNNRILHDVDRKFLFSFWRDCFQNRQQLFLIFIRAEPLAAGDTGDSSNAQLGARGVALVWRDPAPPKSIGNQTRTARDNIRTREKWREELENCPPHRTRVLFYHQFE